MGVYFASSRKLICSLDHTKRSFYRRSLNTVSGKVGRLASEDVVLHLVDSKYSASYIAVNMYGL